MTLTNEKVIKISQLIQPHFYKVWKSDKPYNILKGGRNSFKSSTVSLLLVMMMKRRALQHRKANIICIRENAAYLRDTVYSQIEWALDMLDMTNDFAYKVSPLQIVHKKSGSTFYFYGSDDPMKLKSNMVRDVVAVWYEEAANQKSAEVFNQVNPTFMRQHPDYTDQVKFFFTYNPPRDPYNWINEWVKSLHTDDDYLIDTSSYLDDKLGVISEQQLTDIERYKNNDYDYYRYLYLGEAVGLGNNVWNMDLIHLQENVPENENIYNLFFSADVGHQTSATAVLAFGLTDKNNVYLLDTYYYSPAGKVNKKAPSEFVPEIKNFMDKVKSDYKDAPIRDMVIDSAEGGLRNEWWLREHTRWAPVKKLDKANMIDYCHDLLAQGRFFVLNNQANQIFLEEAKQYRWDEKTLESGDPKVIKEFDHAQDAFQYFAVNNARILGIKG